MSVRFWCARHHQHYSDNAPCPGCQAENATLEAILDGNEEGRRQRELREEELAFRKLLEFGTDEEKAAARRKWREERDRERREAEREAARFETLRRQSIKAAEEKRRKDEERRQREAQALADERARLSGFASAARPPLEALRAAVAAAERAAKRAPSAVKWLRAPGPLLVTWTAGLVTLATTCLGLPLGSLVQRAGAAADTPAGSALMVGSALALLVALSAAVPLGLLRRVPKALVEATTNLDRAREALRSAAPALLELAHPSPSLDPELMRDHAAVERAATGTPGLGTTALDARRGWIVPGLVAALALAGLAGHWSAAAQAFGFWPAWRDPARLPVVGRIDVGVPISVGRITAEDLGHLVVAHCGLADGPNYAIEIWVRRAGHEWALLPAPPFPGGGLLRAAHVAPILPEDLGLEPGQDAVLELRIASPKYAPERTRIGLGVPGDLLGRCGGQPDSLGGLFDQQTDEELSCWAGRWRAGTSADPGYTEALCRERVLFRGGERVEKAKGWPPPAATAGPSPSPEPAAPAEAPVVEQLDLDARDRAGLRLSVHAGEVLAIEAHGSIHTHPGGRVADCDIDCGPAGLPACPYSGSRAELHGLPFMGLLAEFDGQRVLVGEAAELRPERDGELRLVVNDWDHSDNRGTFQLTVTRSTAPAAASPSPGP